MGYANGKSRAHKSAHGDDVMPPVILVENPVVGTVETLLHHPISIGFYRCNMRSLTDCAASVLTIKLVLRFSKAVTLSWVNLLRD